MNNVVVFPDRHEALRVDALRMARSGASVAAVEQRFGWDVAQWARAMLWEQNGCRRDDEGGWATWIRVFGGDAPAEHHDAPEP